VGKTIRISALGVSAAIVITSSMDATGLSTFSALPLAPLLVLFAYLERIGPHPLGFSWGRLRDYRLAILYPVVVLGLIVLVAAAGGVVDTAHTNVRKAALNFLLIGVSTVIVAIVTEEGFFRGWLFASLRRAGLSSARVVLWSSVCFALWHVSAVSLPTGFDLPAAQIPLFLINAAVIGTIWGTLRLISGSVIVTSVSHGLWNAGDYALFAFGTKTGALGIKNTAIYGPEVGVVGLTLNVVFALLLWQWYRVRCSRLAKDARSKLPDSGARTASDQDP
jgi:membrane protease YdiL (CAAX protease family)